MSDKTNGRPFNMPEEYAEAMQQLAAIFFEAGQLIGHERAAFFQATAAAQSDHAAIAELLIEKGVITREEYTAALVTAARQARDHASAWLLNITGLVKPGSSGA